MMKTTILASLLTTALSLPALAALPAGAVANFSLALTLKSILPGTFERNAEGKFIKDEETNQRIPTVSNEWSITKGDKVTTYAEVNVKTVSEKYGNKELLLDLKDAGVLDDTTIAGWSIKVITVGTSSTQTFFIVKKGKPSVQISDFIGYKNFNYDEGESTTTLNAIDQLITQVTVDEEPESFKFQYTGLMESMNGFFIDINDTGGNLYGLMTISQKFGTTKSDDLISLVNVAMPVIAGPFATVDASTLARGSLKISGAKVVEDLSTVLGDL